MKNPPVEKHFLERMNKQDSGRKLFWSCLTAKAPSYSIRRVARNILLELSLIFRVIFYIFRAIR